MQVENENGGYVGAGLWWGRSQSQAKTKTPAPPLPLSRPRSRFRGGASVPVEHFTWCTSNCAVLLCYCY
jgi:hypothetical protein